MLFNSLHFVFFFPIVVAIYFLLSAKHRIYFLLVASYYFYMCWKAEYALLILFSTLIDYYAAIQMQNAEGGKRRGWLIVSLTSNLSVLFLFKYFNFFSDSVHDLLANFNIFYDQTVFDLLLPVGISFYTFQTLSYSIDVYNRKLVAERNFPRFALFVSFFPQLVAGPIERATHLLPQFKIKHQFDYVRIVSGLRLMLWGFFKKIVIADRLSLIVEQVYNNPSDQNGMTYLVATYFFAFQIYCDFSGYSDIAIGSARIMGYDLMENFRQPYFSKSIREFWSRWHISLSTWFRDYVYIPLGGNRRVKWRWYYNLLLTFLISGLWHGANWTFVIWGALHGILLIIGIRISPYFKAPKQRITSLLRIILIFHLVLLSWIFFRSENLSQVVSIFASFKEIPQLTLAFLHGQSIFTGLGGYSFSIVLYGGFLIATLLIIDWLSSKERFRQLYLGNAKIRWFGYAVLFYWIIFGGYFGETSFIYFQF